MLEVDDIIDGKYRIVRLIGKGGMGAVFEARNTGTGRRVAIKVIRSSGQKNEGEQLVQRFQREARAAGAIESQHIGQVLDTGVDAPRGVPYLVLEYLTGQDAQQLLRRLGPLPVDLALRIFAQACLGLARAHEANVIHRDIKPANVFLADREGDEVVCKLLDFGVAKFNMEQADADAEPGEHQAGLTQTGALLGSPLYMSPEQARGRRDIDHRADLWSAGILLYKLLSGRTPREDKSQGIGDLIMAICLSPPPLIREVAPWVPAEVEAILERVLRLAPDERYQSATEIINDLKPLLPNGFAITKDMLVPRTPGERVSIPPSVAGMPASTSGVGLSKHEGSSPSGSRSADSMAAASASQSSSSRMPMMIALAVGIGILGVGAYLLSASAQNAKAPITGNAGVQATAETAKPPEVTTTPPSSPSINPLSAITPSASTSASTAHVATEEASAAPTSTSRRPPAGPAATAVATATSEPAASNPKTTKTVPTRSVDSTAFGDRK